MGQQVTRASIRRWGSAAAAASLLLLVAGCGSDRAATTEDTASPSPSESPSKSAETPTNNVGDNALQVGQWREGSDIRSQVQKVIQPAKTQPPDFLSGADRDGALLQIRMCSRPKTSEPAPIGSYNWYAYDADGGEYTPNSSSWENWPPQPQFPSEVNLGPGRCATGWILLSVPRDTKLALVSLGQGADAVAEWKIS